MRHVIEPPGREAAASPTARDAAADRRRPVVLILQSDEDNRDMYAEFLGFAGFRAIRASSASDALALAPSADVIVTGIALPGEVDGVDLIAKLRAADGTKHIPIIALTTFSGNVQRAIAAGCDRCLLKPCLPEELLAEVRRLVADPQPRPAFPDVPDCRRHAPGSP